MTTEEQAPRFLLIVRERLRPGMEEAYGKNELELAAACATSKCPHPYLALAPVAGPREVWWLNAFASQEEKDQLDSAYPRNEPLMAKLRPLGQRKEGGAAAERIAAGAGRGWTILAVQPQWSFPADAWIAADPDFWSSNPVARNRPA